jgi:hypothetical protein
MPHTSADEQDQLDGRSGRLPGRTVLLLVLAGASTLSFLLVPPIFSIPGLPALLIAIVAALSWRNHPARCRTLTTVGYCVYGGIVLLQIVATVLDLGSTS